MSIPVKILRKESYQELVRRLVQDSEVYAPVTKSHVVMYSRIQSPGEIEDDYILPRLSAKSMLFPAVEPLFSYRKSKGDVQVSEPDTGLFPERVIMGVRPCDAWGLKILHSTFAADPKDEIFEARFDRMIIIGLSCSETDEYCFCPEGTPGSITGSDILLTRRYNGDFMAEIVTGKGTKIVDRYPDLFEVPSDQPDKNRLVAKMPHTVAKESLVKKLPEAFNSNVFEEQALRCIGCGTCAYVCPICSCFDIQDESRGNCGKRLRCWDSCAFSLFTKHTSGHNPRNTQGQRWRQRLMHKFSYMPANGQPTGCVGCGRCSRSCPVDMNLSECLYSIENG